MRQEELKVFLDGRVVVKVKLPTGTAVGETNKLLSQVEAKLVGDPLIESRKGCASASRVRYLTIVAADGHSRIRVAYGAFVN